MLPDSFRLSDSLEKTLKFENGVFFFSFRAFFEEKLFFSSEKLG